MSALRRLAPRPTSTSLPDSSTFSKVAWPFSSFSSASSTTAPGMRSAVVQLPPLPSSPWLPGPSFRCRGRSCRRRCRRPALPRPGRRCRRRPLLHRRCRLRPRLRRRCRRRARLRCPMPSLLAEAPRGVLALDLGFFGDEAGDRFAAEEVDRSACRFRRRRRRSCRRSRRRPSPRRRWCRLLRGLSPARNSGPVAEVVAILVVTRLVHLEGEVVLLLPASGMRSWLRSLAAARPGMARSASAPERQREPSHAEAGSPSFSAGHAFPPRFEVEQLVAAEPGGRRRSRTVEFHRPRSHRPRSPPVPEPLSRGFRSRSGGITVR